jgi:hypothetical protein
MCPDPQLLSIYLDGELPSPWKEKMQDHFAQCPKCKEKLENFRRLQELFKEDRAVKRTFVERIVDEPSEPRTYTEQDLIQTKERIWNKIEKRQCFMPRSGLLQRKLSIPLPAAAAAAVIILLLTAFWIRGANQVEPSENTNFILAAEMDNIQEIPGIIPAADMSGLLQYLSPQNTGTNIIILQLPESKNFFRSGEPAMIRAADFSRNDVPRAAERTRRHP